MEWRKGETIWRQIERQLAEDIEQGLFAPGEQIPTEKALAERFDVNRHTVRRAVAALTESGLLRVEQGRGSFVQESMIDYPLGARTRFSQIVSSRQRMPDRQLLKHSLIKADKRIARKLHLATGKTVICLESISIAEDVPLAHTLSYLPANRFDGIEKILQKTKSLTEAFKYYKIADYTRKESRITAHIAGPKISQLLKQAPGKPILQTESIDVDESGTPIEFGVTSFCSDRVQLLVQP